MLTKTWTRERTLATEGKGFTYRRNGYRVQRMGNFWQIRHGDAFLGTAPNLRQAKTLATTHEADQAWTLARCEHRARSMSDWNLRQAYGGAKLRHDEAQASIYRAELDRREVLTKARQAAFEAATERARTQYTMHAYRAPFSGEVFNHIMAPGTGWSLCGRLHGGPGEALDLGKVDCLICMEKYAAVMLAPAQT